MPELISSNFYKVVSLLSLLRIYAENYVRLIHCAAQISTALTNYNDPPSLQNDLVISALGIFDGIKPQLKEAGLKSTVAQMNRIEERWNQYKDKKIFLTQCQEMLLRLEDELRARVLLLISEDEQNLFTNPRADWKDCLLALPATTDNVDEMNRCFALSRYAASVFHSLLIAEAGLMELGKHIGVTDPKIGWDATCKRLAEICKAGHVGYAYPIPFSSIEQINQCVQSMKLAWRNKINHEAGRLVVLDPQFTEPQAHEIIIATRSFMRWIARALPR